MPALTSEGALGPVPGEKPEALAALYAGTGPTVSPPFNFFLKVAPPGAESEVIDTNGMELVFKGPLAHCLAWVAAKNTVTRGPEQSLEDWKSHQAKAACELLLTIVDMGVKSVGDTLVSRGVFTPGRAEEILLTSLVEKYGLASVLTKGEA